MHTWLFRASQSRMASDIWCIWAMSPSKSWNSYVILKSHIGKPRKSRSGLDFIPVRLRRELWGSRLPDIVSSAIPYVSTLHTCKIQIVWFSGKHGISNGKYRSSRNDSNFWALQNQFKWTLSRIHHWTSRHGRNKSMPGKRILGIWCPL